jgi:hypothetical protein
MVKLAMPLPSVAFPFLKPQPNPPHTSLPYLRTVYAPLQRDGTFPDNCPQRAAELALDPDSFAALPLGALNSLEASLPKRLLSPRLQPQRPPARPRGRERQVGRSPLGCA